MTKNKRNTKLTRKVLSVALAAALLGGTGTVSLVSGSELFGSASITASAATDESYFETSDNGDGTVTITETTREADSLTVLVVPSTIDGKKVTAIGNEAFQGIFSRLKNITKITIPDTVETVGKQAFYSMPSLTEVVFEGGVKSIGDLAFCADKSLKKVTFPEGLEDIGNSAFSGCTSLTNIEIPSTVISIGKSAFNGCSDLQSITLPDNLKTISNETFSDCNTLATVKLPKNLQTINQWAFRRCSAITSIDFPNTLVTIDSGAFDQCTGLKAVIVPKSVLTIGGQALGIDFTSPVNGFILYCVKGSDAENYAKTELYGPVNYKLITASLNKTSEKVLVGKTVDLKATVSPSDSIIDKTVTWKSSDTSVATVDSNGKVTTLKSGTAKITASTKYNGVSAVCTVNVKANPTGINLSKSSLSILQGSSATVTPTLAPTNAYDVLTWTSSDNSVATVSNGKITAKKTGTATITAKTINGKTANVKVTVTVNPTKVTVNKSSATLEKGKTLTLKATVTPTKYVSSSKVTWSSSNKSVATVNASGKVTAKKAGTTTITAKTTNGKTAKVKITVKTKPTSVKLSKTSANLKKGKSLTLKATVNPKNYVTTSKVTWSTSNSKIATVKNGKVTAKKAGTVTITAKTANGKTAKCKVTVKK